MPAITSPFNPEKILATLPNKPGIYRLLDCQGTVLYVGKAYHLKKRVASYFNKSKQTTAKTQALIRQVASVEVTVTHTESEALILENTLIKTYQPRYNILLRDDKSYPYLHLSAHPFPRLSFYRGVKREEGRYFGPYPHARAAHESLGLLQKLFPIRQCRDSFYQHRSRPCLQYQIKRCTAPCVGLIEPESYQDDVHHTVLFLEGKSQAVITTLIEKMQAAAQVLDFEKAARYRDQISQLRQLQAQHDVPIGSVDVVVGVIQNAVACIQLLTLREGQPLNNYAFFPKHTQDADETALLAAFLPQYYLASGCQVPDTLIVNRDFPDKELLATVLTQHYQRSIRLQTPTDSQQTHWVNIALENAQVSLAQRCPPQYQAQLAALGTALGLSTLPHRVDCFDVSHTLGEATVAACVVFDSQGPCFNAYRRFNIEGIRAGDDCAALRQALQRRYKSLQNLPDIVLIDGGIAQVNVARSVLAEYALPHIQIIGIAKGVERKPGLETLLLSQADQFLTLALDSTARLLIQHIRDEAHRFAITAHRKQLAKTRKKSMLEKIAGVGPKRRQHLINHFGGLQGVSRAGVDELAQVPGISRQLAQKIYDFFLTT